MEPPARSAHFQFVGTDPALEAAGKAYYEYRAALMVNNNEGMTKSIQLLPVASDGTDSRLKCAAESRPQVAYSGSNNLTQVVFMIILMS